MSAKVVVPSVGESITQGVIANWLKGEGEMVASGDSLFELETDKITAEIPALTSGRLHILVPAGSTVAIGAEVGSIEPSGSAVPTALPQAKVPPPQATVKESAQPSAPTTPTTPSVVPIAPPALDRAATDGLPPSLRRLILERGLTPQQVVAAASQTLRAEGPRQTTPSAPPVAKGAPAPEVLSFAPGQRELRKKMTPLRQRIAQRLVASQAETATLTTFNEVDMSAVMELREKNKELFKARYGVGLGFMSFFVKATIAALKTVPEVNARLEGGEVVYQNFFDIGIAVSTQKGLVVPILRNADQLSLAQIEQGIAELANKARDNKLTIDDLTGGTFTISNGGIYGSLMSTPILNPPQSGILGMHAIKKRAIVVNDTVVIRPMMYLALSYDHRLVDGKESVTFLVTLKDYIESPAKFLLELV